MRLLSLILIVFLPFQILSQSDTTLVATCCGGKCTGSANCTACTNCSGCKHCNSGGSCGVCSKGSTKWKPASTPSPVTTPKKSSGTSTAAPISDEKRTSSTDKIERVSVSAAVLNLRKGPETSYDIVLVLTKNEVLTIVERTSTGWIKVTVERLENGKSVTYTGYVNAKYVE